MSTLTKTRNENSDPSTSQQACAVLIERVKDQIGSSVNVLIVEPGSLERSMGKHKRVYDLR